MTPDELKELLFVRSVVGVLDGMLQGSAGAISKEAASRALSRAVAEVRVKHGLQLASPLTTAVRSSLDSSGPH
jgi:hypothetical protein